MAAAERCLIDAVGGRGGVLLISGEPGIGKTRLAEHVSALADSRRVPVVWGRCVDEEGVPPYWPWRRVLRSVGGERPGDAPRPLAGFDSGPLGVLLAGDGGLGEPRPASSPAEPGRGEERFMMFEAATRVLLGAAVPCGLVIVLDDLQWADPESALLLMHLGRELADSRLLVVATCRDDGSEANAVLSGVLAALSRERLTRIWLEGLTGGEVALALEGIGAAGFDDEIVAAVARRSGGNPFFVAELGRLLDDAARAGRIRRETWEHGLPDGVQAAVSRRLDRLAGRCREVLRAASVLGMSIDVGALAAVGGQTAAAVVAELEVAVRAKLVAPGATPAQFDFAHALVRDTLYREVPIAERLDVHLRMAEHLQAAHAQDLDRYSALLAHHRLSALPCGDAARAVEWAQRAAVEALDGYGYEQAAALYAAALDAAPLAGLGPSERCRLQLGRARALLRAGDVSSAIDAAIEAGGEARRSGDPLAMADAVVSLEGVSDERLGRQVMELGDHALRDLPDGQLERRARVMAAMSGVASTSMIDADALRRHSLSRDALTLAETAATPAALISALNARYLACGDPDGVHDRMAVAERMLAVADQTRDSWAELWGRLWRIDVNFQLGETNAADADLTRLAEVCGRLDIPLADWHLARNRCAIEMGRGRFAEAYAQLDRARHCGEQLDIRARQTHAMTAALLSILTGEPMSGWFVATLEEHSTMPKRLMLVRLYAAHGDLERAADEYALLPPWPAWRFPHFVALAACFTRAQAAAVLGRTDDAAEAHRRLLPWAHYFATTATGSTGLQGSVHLALGVAAACLEDREQAKAQLRAAIAANERAGLAPHVAECQYQLAALLATSSTDEERDEALRAARSALRTGQELGMQLLRSQAEGLAASLGDRSPDPLDPLSRRERDIAQLVAQGLTNRQIADALYIAERTAENHVQHILTKLGFQNRSQIAVWAAGTGTVNSKR